MEKELKELIILAEKYKEYIIFAKFKDNETILFSKNGEDNVRIFIDGWVYIVLIRNIRIKFKDEDDFFSEGDNITLPFGITIKELKETYTVAKKIFDNLPDADGVEKTNELLLAL